MAVLKPKSNPSAAVSRVLNSRLSKLVLIAACFSLVRVDAQEEMEEYQVKAAFVYNFVKFVVWPEGAFKGPGDPITACILGEGPLQGELEKATRGKTIDGRPFRIQQAPGTDLSCKCHIVFVSASGRKRFHDTGEDLKATGVLTIGESPGFASEGGVINFKLEGGRVRFEINLKAAEQRQLHISSKLLSLAQIVK
jgi:hypothetical protein